jgi:hypothetical protein
VIAAGVYTGRGDPVQSGEPDPQVLIALGASGVHKVDKRVHCRASHLVPMAAMMRTANVRLDC